MILKIVGYAEAAVQYYRMPDTRAHVWIAHQRYPTKGRVWHPGGAHPFIGLNEALVHNGDFANYHSVCEYLASATSSRSSSPTPRSRCCCSTCGTGCTAIRWSTSSRPWRRRPSWTSTGCRRRSSGSTGRSRRPTSTPRRTARGSSSSPAAWPRPKQFQLLGITDTAMLRPQVFALQEGEVSIGLICSEKQAIDATLASLAARRPAVHARGRHATGTPAAAATPTAGRSC